MLEILIANLIHQGASFEVILTPVELIKNKKNKEITKTKITNITLDFIARNPEFKAILKHNDRAHNFLNSIKSNLKTQ